MQPTQFETLVTDVAYRIIKGAWVKGADYGNTNVLRRHSEEDVLATLLKESKKHLYELLNESRKVTLEEDPDATT